MEQNNTSSMLRLNKLVFDHIEFKRKGISSEHETNFQIQSNIAQKKNEDSYKVTLTLKGDKPEEYTLEISITGFFSFTPEEDMDEEKKNTLIQKNTIAILMPYLRSELSLLTAQPGMDCVVLPPFNINKMING